MTLTDAEGLIRSGIIAAQERKFEEAAQWLEKAIIASPNREDAHYHLGNTLAALGALKEAIDHLKITVSLNAHHPEAHNNLGRLLHKTGLFDEAVIHYQAAIQCRPRYSDAEVNLGLLWVADSKYESAKRQFQSILEWNTNLPIVYEQLAQLALQEENITQAKQYYRELLKFPIHSSDTWNNIGAVFSKEGDNDEALHAFTQSLLLNPKHAEARNNRAAIYLQKHSLQEAIWEYTLYLRLVPTDATGYYNIGVAWMLSGRLQEAIAAFEEALKLSSDYIEAWCNLGAVYIQQENLLLAYQMYQEVLLREPKHEGAGFMISALQQVDTVKKQINVDVIPTPLAAPVSFVRALFDNYAYRFDHHLIETLEYQVPRRLYDLIQPYVKDAKFKALDLGCGTGLVGTAFQSVLGSLTGVDISTEMLSKAREKNIYQQLIEKDILQFLTQSDQHYELILCGDTLCYFGELTEIFKKVFGIASAKAYFGFSVELLIKDVDRSAVVEQDPYYQLQPTGRYQHQLASIKDIAEDIGWQWVNDLSIKGRLHQGRPVLVGLCMMQKP